ncbi:MAG: hypothetical protein OSB73_13315 [Candidatus Latescibacteria bacterium]|nr:hypothetical protein [Candidatus Latescibacterota bacterium]
MKNFRVCMLTTGFPRFQGDLFGTFVQELAQELTRGGEMAVEVLAPHAVGLPTSERFGAVEVRRFRYFGQLHDKPSPMAGAFQAIYARVGSLDYKCRFFF